MFSSFVQRLRYWYMWKTGVRDGKLLLRVIVLTDQEVFFSYLTVYIRTIDRAVGAVFFSNGILLSKIFIKHLPHR
jgi:hypothetical protein